MSSSDLDTKSLELQAEYYSVLSSFEEVFKKYREAILLQPITKDNEDNLNSIYNGLKNLKMSFDNISEAYQALCATRGIILT